MSEVPDLGALSELFQDLSVQLRRLNIRQDGEPRASTDPEWDDIPTSVLGPEGGPGRERRGDRLCDSPAGRPVQQCDRWAMVKSNRTSSLVNLRVIYRSRVGYPA